MTVQLLTHRPRHGEVTSHPCLHLAMNECLSLPSQVPPRVPLDKPGLVCTCGPSLFARLQPGDSAEAGRWRALGESVDDCYLADAGNELYAQRSSTYCQEPRLGLSASPAGKLKGTTVLHAALLH
jgi:hypothetical protein